MEKLLGESGLMELWSKIKDRSFPSKETTKAEFDRMSDEEKKGLMVVMDDDSQALVSGFKIEEYDTTVDGCDWHIRKWSNGYCEFYGKVKYPSFECTNEWGGVLFNGEWMRGPLYPFDLKFVYKSDVLIEHSNNTGILYTAYTAPGANDLLKGSPSFNFFRPSSNTLSNLVIVFHTVGRWK